MAKLLDCAAVSSLEIIDPALTVSATVTGGYVVQSGKQVPALLATWSTISNPYVTGIQFEYGPSDLSSGAKQSTALKAALAWSTTSSVVAGGTYTTRYRAIGVGANTYGPWTAPSNKTVPAAPPIVAGDFDTTGPAAPGAVTLSQTTTIMSDGTTATFMKADWPDNVEADLDGYKIQWTEDGVGLGFYPVTTSVDTIRTKAGSAYIATVFAMDKLGNPSTTGSASSSLVAGQDTTAPGAASGFGVTQLARRLVWQWAVPGDDDYAGLRIYRNTTGTGPSGGTTPTFGEVAPITGTIFADTNVSAGTVYYYWCQTVDRTGNPGAWTYMGSGNPAYVSIGGGDVLLTDPLLNTNYGNSAGVIGAGSGLWANNMDQLNAAEGAKFKTISEYASSDVQLVAIGTVTLVGNTATKTGTNDWNAGGYYSRNSYVGGIAVSFRRGNGYSDDAIVGINSDTTPTGGIDNIDYGLRTVFGSSAVYIYENSAYIGTFTGGIVDANDLFTITYDGLYVRYYCNSTLLREVPTTAGRRFYLMGDNYSVGDGVRDLLVRPFTSNAWEGIGGTGRPSDNAGTSGILTPLGTYSFVKGNSVLKSLGGTHGSWQGGAVGAAQKGSCYISSSLLNAAGGGGWSTQLALDDDATSFSPDPSYMVRYITYGGSGDVTFFVGGVGVATITLPAMTAASRMTLAYDGAAVFVRIDGITYYSYPAPAGLRLWPKVIDYYNSADLGGDGIIDIQHGAWTENTVSAVQLRDANSNRTEINGNTAYKIAGGSDWSAGVASRESYVGACVVSFRPGNKQSYQLVMAGLTDAHAGFTGYYPELDYCWYFDGVPSTTSAAIYESGAPQGTGMAVGSWTADDVFSIAYDGTNVRYFHNGVVKRTVATSPGRQFYFGSSYYDVGGGLRDIQFGPGPQAARTDSIWNTAGTAQYGTSSIVNELGNSAGLIGGGNLLYVTLPSYASLAAATAGGLTPGKQFYNTTTNKPEAVPGGGGFGATSSATGRSATRSGAGTATTSTVTITPTGATGTVTYAWYVISGDTSISATGSAAATTAFTGTVAVAQTKIATFACAVTDTGSGQTITLLVTVVLTETS